MIISILFAMILHFQMPVWQNSSVQALPATHAATFRQESPGLYHLAQYPESEKGDKNALKPYKGFDIVALGAVVLVLAAIVFVVYRVWQRMNKGQRRDR